MNLTYHSYLKIEDLLTLQELKSQKEHDELLFIIIHQAYELWFKEMLHEIDYVQQMIGESDIPQARHKMKRVLTIMKVLVHQVDVLETMTPLEFLSFRDYLQSASGFQSYQWRELEFALGKKAPHHIARFTEDGKIREKLESRFHAPSLWISFLRYLKKLQYPIPDDIINGDMTASNPASELVQDTLVEIYLNQPELAQLCEMFVDLDEGMQEWRYRHVKMVERTIGNKTGTGGSTGVEYLKASLFVPLFPDLWTIRSSFTV